MADEGPQRFVLLNRLVSRSATRASEEHKPPMVPGAELLGIIDKRRAQHLAIEFPGLAEPDRETEKGERSRIARGKGHDFIWLRQMKIEEQSPWKFATLLFEFVDASKRNFSVVEGEAYWTRNTW
jgi:hypothetical protein